jgi:DNA invertase Pin-like site-specific DNA recombinase
MDEGFSGRKASRPALDRLMKDATARKIDCILVYKLDRFGRSVQNLSDLLKRLDLAGVRFIAITQGIDTDRSNPASRLLLHVLAAVAEFESDLIRERVTAGIAEYARAFKAGRARPSKSGLNLAVGRPERIWDRSRARELRHAGMSLREVAAQLGVSTMTLQRGLKE